MAAWHTLMSSNCVRCAPGQALIVFSVADVGSEMKCRGPNSIIQVLLIPRPKATGYDPWWGNGGNPLVIGFISSIRRCPPKINCLNEHIIIEFWTLEDPLKRDWFLIGWFIKIRRSRNILPAILTRNFTYLLSSFSQLATSEGGRGTIICLIF